MPRSRGSFAATCCFPSRVRGCLERVLGAMEYLLLEQSTHIALSNSTVSVGLQKYYDGNATFENTSILLIDASTNQTVAKKWLLQSQNQGIAVFECFHFKNAGKYWLKMASESWQHEEIIPLSVKWPIFNIDLRRTSEELGSSIQFKLFTGEYLCPINKTVIHLDIILTSSLYDLGELILNETIGLRTSKELSLIRSQWVNYNCLLTGQDAYVTVLLRSTETDSVIASEGPINLVHRFGYKLVVEEVVQCDSSVVVSVIPPPCTSPGGHIAVFKDLERSGQRTIKLRENIMNPEDNQTEFNCALFDEGTNKYCFEFSISHRVIFPSRAKECVLIQRNVGSWGLWQAWSPCSVTCGEGIRERFRECPTSFPLKQGCTGAQQETSLCSLEECSTTQSVPITLVYPEEEQRASSNLVTVSGISVCLSIIFATILITVWRKLCRSQKCVGTPLPCDPTHSPSFRKNSDEENICQETQHRESFSEGEAQCSPSGDPDIPLRRSFHFAQDKGGALANESFQSSAQKIIPPIFSYRLAQQQLKEMKKKGLTETTKVYHVSQNPLTDTVLSTSVGSEKQEGATANTFRIKSPFLEPLPGYPKLSRDKPCSRMDFSLSQAVPSFSPTQSLTRRGQSRYPENLGEPFERCYSRNSQFRRTASFHETKKPKPFRKRCMSALTPSQTPLYHTRARTWDRAPEDHLWPKSKSTYWNSEELELHYNPSSTVESVTCAVPNPPKWEAPGKKPDLVSRHQPAQTLCADKADQKRNRKGPFLNHMGAWRNEAAARTFKDGPQRGDALSPTQFRRSKCQSFPSNPEYHFYDNTSFGMAELEQQMTDLPGYFGSNEGEISSLSIDNLVL